MIRKILIILAILTSNLFADYYEVRARGGSAFIYSSQANALSGETRKAVKESPKKGKKKKAPAKKTYIAKLGDLNVRKVRFVSEKNNIVKITFFDVRARTNHTGYVRSEEARKVLIKEEPTEEEKQAAKKAAREKKRNATSLKVSVKASALQKLKSSFNLKDDKEINAFIAEYPNYRERHLVNLEMKKQILDQQSNELAEIVPKLQELEGKNISLKTEKETQLKRTVDLTESNKKLKNNDKEHKKQVKDLELEVNNLKSQKKAELKAAKKQGFIWAAIAGVLGFFISTKIFNRF